MTHPRRRSDEPPPEPDLSAVLATLDGIARRAGLLLDGAEQVITAARDGLPLPEGLDRRALALLAAGLRHTGSETAETVRELERIKLGQVFGTAAEAFIRADERAEVAAAAPARRRHAHRKPGRGQLELIPGGRWKAPAVSGAAVLAAFRHAATAKGAAIGTTAAAAAAVVTISTSGFTTLPMTTPAPPPHAQAFAGIAPTQALPVPSLAPSPLRTYVPKHAKPSMNAATATLAPPPPVETVTATPPPSVPSAAPQDPAYGTLDVQQVAVAIDPSGTAQITFTAVGGALQWHALSNSSDLSLSSGGGILGSGQSFSLIVSVPPGTLAGAGSVTITAGGQQVVVPVTWVSLPGL